MRTHLLATLTLLLIWASASAETFYFTFKNDTRFGVAALAIDPAHKLTVTELAPEFTLDESFKLTLVGDRLVVAAEVGGLPGVAIYDLKSNAKTPPEFVETAGAISEIKSTEGIVIAATSKGRVYRLDPAKPTRIKEWSGRKSLTPPGRKGEDILLLPAKQAALVSFQKDDNDSDARGSRIVVLGFDDLTLRGDLQLPRDHPDKHLDGNPEEQGPNPEKIFAFPDSNTLAVTLDLYGAVAFMDLDAALDGRIENYSATPSSADGAWGTAFPDKGLGFRHGDRDWLLVTNASVDGGLALFDVAARQREHVFPTAVGCEAPFRVPGTDFLATVPSGKVKVAGAAGLDKSMRPGSDLILIDLAKPFADAARAIPIGSETSHAIPLENSNVVVFTISPPTAAVVDPATAAILGTTALPGAAIRVTQ